MDTLLWLLALFGLWQLALTIWRWLLSFRFVPPQVSLLFLVKNNQDSVEGLFRQLALDCYFLGGYSVPGRVLVVDLGSQDQTLAILRRLVREFSFLHLRTLEETQVGEVLEEFRQGVLILDLRVLHVKEALKAARYILQKTAPKHSSGQMARRADVNTG
jgi:hypothetical protein